MYKLVHVFALLLHALCTYVFFKANIGQDEDFKAAKEKAERLGAKKVRNTLTIITNISCFHTEVFLKMPKQF